MASIVRSTCNRTRSKPRSVFRFAVLGDSEGDAQRRFAEARDAWCSAVREDSGSEQEA